MLNSEIIQILSAFDSKNWKRFQVYLESPYFNKREDLKLLAKVLQNALAKRATQPKLLGKQEVWQRVFPHTPYEDKAFRYLLSDLLEQAESFLAQEAWMEHPDNAKAWMYSRLRRLNRPERAAKKLPRATNWDLLDTDQDLAIHRVIQRYLKDELLKEVSESKVPFQQYLNQFSDGIVTELLRQGCDMLEHNRRSEHQAELPLLKLVLEDLTLRDGYNVAPTVRMWHLTYLLLRDQPEPGSKGVDYFHELFTYFYDVVDIPALYKRECWLYAGNFAFRKFNRGDWSLLPTVFRLFRDGLEKGILMDHGQINRATYSNTVLFGLLLEEWDWAEKFIHEYKQYLPLEIRENIWYHNLATMYFMKKDYQKVLETLQNVVYTDTFLNMDDRRLLLCSYYELKEWDALDSLLNSFGVWIRRSKEKQVIIESYKNLIKFTRRLIDIRTKDEKSKEALKEEIKQTGQVGAKRWLLEKLEELK